jgi:hypothetical protein
MYASGINGVYVYPDGTKISQSFYWLLFIG